MGLKDDEGLNKEFVYTLEIDPNDIPKYLRHFIYQYFINNSKAPTLEDMMTTFNFSKRKISNILLELELKHQIKLVPGVPRVLMAWPFSNIPTQYVVKTSGNKSYFANCAWDAIAFHIILDQDIKIETYCAHCNSPINLTVTKNSIIEKNPSSVIINFSKPIKDWMDNVIDTCGNTMNFFISKQHLDEYKIENPTKPNFTFTDDQIIALSKLIYTRRAELDYKRPNTEEIKDLLNSVKLNGEFWEVDEYH